MDKVYIPTDIPSDLHEVYETWIYVKFHETCFNDEFLLGILIKV